MGSSGPEGNDLTDLDNQCRGEATGPLCSQCPSNYYSSDGRCVECEQQTWVDYVVDFGPIVGAVLLMALAVAAWWCLSKAESSNQPQFIKDANGFVSTKKETFVTWYRSNK